MDHFISKFEKPRRADPVRIFEEIWRNHSCLENVRSAYGMVVIGYPAKQIEWLSLGTHRISFTAEQLRAPLD
jgi:hypothetical protein